MTKRKWFVCRLQLYCVCASEFFLLNFIISKANKLCWLLSFKMFRLADYFCWWWAARTRRKRISNKKRIYVEIIISFRSYYTILCTLFSISVQCSSLCSFCISLVVRDILCALRIEQQLVYHVSVFIYICVRERVHVLCWNFSCMHTFSVECRLRHQTFIQTQNDSLEAFASFLKCIYQIYVRRLTLTHTHMQ